VDTQISVAIIGFAAAALGLVATVLGRKKEIVHRHVYGQEEPKRGFSLLGFGGVLILVVGLAVALVMSAAHFFKLHPDAASKKDSGSPSGGDTSLLTEWTVIAGRWEIKGALVKYVGPDDPGSTTPYGLILSKAQCGKGVIETTVRFLGDWKDRGAFFAFGYDKGAEEYYSIGLRHSESGTYLFSDFKKAVGWTPLAWAGDMVGPKAHVEYRLKGAVSSSAISLTMNDVTVLEKSLPKPMVGDQVGLFAWGPGPIEFKDTKLSVSKP
jgi:hypothetical protein